MPKTTEKKPILLESLHFSVSIKRTADDSEKDICEWLFSMRPEMWRLEKLTKD
jgi:hypothetical protein